MTREDELTALRARLERIDEVPVTERPALFAAVNDAIVDELASMEED
jgi:hypothetical protein